MKRLMMIAAAMTISGCATPLPESSRIISTGNPEQVRGCQFLGQETGRQYLIGGIVLMGAAQEDANRRLRNQAAAKGATHLLTTNAQMGMGGATATGDLYRCPPK